VPSLLIVSAAFTPPAVTAAAGETEPVQLVEPDPRAVIEQVPVGYVCVNASEAAATSSVEFTSEPVVHPLREVPVPATKTAAASPAAAARIRRGDIG
jgi:hypothetical protein